MSLCPVESTKTERAIVVPNEMDQWDNAKLALTVVWNSDGPELTIMCLKQQQYHRRF